MRYIVYSQVILATAITCASASAASFYLNSTADLPDINPGDGMALTETGTTTLRAAVEEANALPGKDDIIFTYDASQKTTGTTGPSRAGVATVTVPLVVMDDLFVDKGDFSYSRFDPAGANQFRVLEVMPGVNLELNGIVIEERATGDQHILADRGAAIYIHSGARVALRGCGLRHGIAAIAGGGIYVDAGTLEIWTGYVSGHSQGDGGGIYNDRGTVYVTYSALLGGTAESQGGALFNNRGTVYFSGSDARSNVHSGTAANAGGGISSHGGILVMNSVSVLGNTADLGGAIHLAENTLLDVFGCSFSENSAALDGASIYVESGVMRAALCTFGRGSAGRSGAGVYIAGGAATFLNCTFTNNMAGTAGPAAGGGLAVDAAGGTVCALGNTIIAENTAQLGQASADVSGTIVSFGHNLIGIAEGASGFTGTDLLGSVASPLSPFLQYTFNHEGTPESPHGIYVPQPVSPAIDAGDNALLSHPDFIGGACFDARLTCCPRVRGATVDIGAIEVQEGEIGLTCTGTHSADYDFDSRFSLSELLRAIQLYNSEEYHCASFTEDGYDVGSGDQTCAPHSSDYAPQDWHIGIIELMRVIQFYNLGGYHPCPEGEDTFCPGVE